MTLENQNILIVSNEPWGPFWYSKHNYANELSKKNNVFFLDPPLPFKPGNFLKKDIIEKQISSSLTVLKYHNVLPVSLAGLWKWNDKIVLKNLKAYFNRKKISNILFWTFDPIRLAFPEILEPKTILLHIVDDYLFSYPSESILAQKADAVICVSEKISDNYTRFNKNVLVIRHAIPDDEFLPESKNRKGPVTGIFIGKIDSRIDLDFNLEVFRSFPDVTFRIVGSVDPAMLKLLKAEHLRNVTITDPVPSGELKQLIRASDFCFIFKKIYKGNNIFSHKLLQYLAQGKPVFGTDFSDINPELKESFYLSNDGGEIKQMLAKFINEGESGEKADLRINYAKQNTFSKALSSIEQLFN